MPETPAKEGPASNAAAEAAAKNGHLQILERIISRMGQTAFSTKAWSVTLLAAVLAFGQRDKSDHALWPIIFPALLFWLLDASYFRQERLFRMLYKDAAKGLVEVYSTDTTPYRARCSLWSAFRAWAVWPIHVATIIGVMFKAAGISVLVLLQKVS
jgi:hypothetical protein